jgi:hypothetical protein
MDRDLLLQAVPSNPKLQAAPSHHQKEAAESLIESILDALDADNREPDRCEAEHLSAALGYIIARMFASITKSTIALAPREERAAPETWERTPDIATTRDFRDGLVYVQGILARNL